MVMLVSEKKSSSYAIMNVSLFELIFEGKESFLTGFIKIFRLSLFIF